MLVRLTQKLAERINGIDLSGRAVGDVVDLPDREALVLVAEGWAVILELEKESDRVAPARVGQTLDNRPGDARTRSRHRPSS
jgi:hypothetical protein